MNPALDRLKNRHGWTGGSYRALVGKILATGVTETSAIANELQKRLLTESARRAGASATGNLLIPPTAASLSRDAVLRKAAQDGELLMDTLREKLQNKLRGALESHYNKPGAKWERGEGRGRLDPALVDEFEKAVHQTLDPYCRRNGLREPPNCRAIAETELRSADSMAKEAFAQSVAAANHSRWRITKVWVHHPGLSRTEPREGHRMADGQSRGLGDPFSVPLVDKGMVRGHLSMAHPHDPAAPPSEVISCHCECDYRCVPIGSYAGVGPKTREEREAKWDVGVMKGETLEALRRLENGLLMAVFKDYGVPIGGKIKKPDGSTWERTGPYSYKKVLNPDGTPYVSRSKGTNSGHGKTSAGAQTPSGIPKAPSAQPEPAKAQPKPASLPGMTAAEAKSILDRVGASGLWNLTKEGLHNYLADHGVDPKSLKFSEKHAKAKELMKADLEREKVEGTIKIPKLKEYSNSNFRVPRDHDSHGLIVLFEGAEFEKDPNTPAVPGGHWGSATANNTTAQAVAYSSGTKWRPIDKQVDGNLAEYDTSIDVSVAQLGVKYRKFAQDRIKTLDRNVQPSFFRGMTLSNADWDSIAQGKSDTVELTGCTAFSCFEKIADRYSASKWTKSFGSDRKSVKIVLERDDDVDNSIGMWHRTFSEKQGGQKDPAFELLSGLEALRVVRVEGGSSKSANPDKSRATKVKGYATRAISSWESQANSHQFNVEYFERTMNNNGGPSYYTPDEVEQQYKEAKAKKAFFDKAVTAAKTVNAKDKDFVEPFKNLMSDYYNSGNGNAARILSEMKDSQDVGDSEVKAPDQPEVIEYGRKLGIIDRDNQMTSKGFLMQMIFRHIGDYSLQSWLNNTSPAGSKTLVLHCVAGRGKKSVQGGSEGSPDNAT